MLQHLAEHAEALVRRPAYSSWQAMIEPKLCQPGAKRKFVGAHRIADPARHEIAEGYGR